MSASDTGNRSLTVNRPIRARNPNLRFEPTDVLGWNPLYPEFACATGAVSLLMPHAEPYVVRSAERVLDDLPPEVRSQAEVYIRQERSHHAQHRRFNDAIITWHPRVATLDRLMARAFGFLDRRSSAFGVAFAAGFETIAFAGARWTEPRIGQIFRGADEDASRLFLWHLAEEVEHKGVAHDVWQATDGSRLRYTLAMMVAAAVLAVFSIAGTLMLLGTQRRLFSPRAHWRLAVWSLTFLFEVVTTMVISCLPGHHPDDLTDPLYLMTWLTAVDQGHKEIQETSRLIRNP